MMTLVAQGSWLEIGQRKFPVAPDRRDSHASTLPRSCDVWRTERAQLVFENGWVLSIVWGSGTYSDNRFIGTGFGDPFTDSDSDRPFVENPETVELAAWRDSEAGANGMISWGDDSVAGHVPVDNLLAIIDLISEFPSDSTSAPESWLDDVSGLVP